MINLSTVRRGSLPLLAASALLLGMAAPAAASEKSEKAAGEAASSAASGGGQAAEKKICLSATVTGEATVTGSILSRKECRTKAEWEARGVSFNRK